jgi:hypothetical protein
MQERLSQLKGRKLSLCFYCGGYLVDDGIALRVLMYTEVDRIDEGAVLCSSAIAMRCWNIGANSL